MSLRETLLGWMSGGCCDFDEIALRVFTYQFEQNAAYRNYCEALGKTPKHVTVWKEIPAIPTDVFKMADLPLRCFPESQVEGYFLTSGTTKEIRGKHQYRSLDLYRASVLGAWKELQMPVIAQAWYFSQSAAAAPHSSLVRMFDFLDHGGSWLIDETGTIQLPDKKSPPPNSILGTSLALLHYCDLSNPTTLPKNSWILETGGSKGLKRQITSEAVHARLSDHFGISPERILNEYSMTELFSQFYRWGNEASHIGPPWTAIRIVDLHTGQEAKAGEIGYLEIIDLANLDTVSAIRTQDLAIATGERQFQLIGRDPAAIARGCSRGVEALLTR